MSTWRWLVQLLLCQSLYVSRDLLFPPLCLEDTFLSHPSMQGLLFYMPDVLC